MRGWATQIGVIGLLLAVGCGAEEDPRNTKAPRARSNRTSGPTGVAAFWIDFAECGGVPLDFCVFSEADESCASPQSAPPVCGSGGTANLDVEVGSAHYWASIVSGDVDFVWEGDLDIPEDSCTLVQLECGRFALQPDPDP